MQIIEDCPNGIITHDVFTELVELIVKFSKSNNRPFVRLEHSNGNYEPVTKSMISDLRELADYFEEALSNQTE